MKKILSLALLSVFVSAAFSFSWNGVLDNNTKLSTTGFKELTLDQSNGIYLSVNVPVNEALRFTAEGMYKYNVNVTASKTTLTNTADIDLFKVNYLMKLGTSNLSFDAGRFSYSDVSGAVFSQCSDGVNVKYETAKWKAGFYGGYTGILNSLNVSMTEVRSGSHDFYSLCVPYIPLGVNFAYTSLFGSNAIGAQAFYFKSASNNYTDKIYGIVTLSGPVSTNGSYSTALVAGLNNYKDFMLYLKADYTAFINNNCMFNGGIEYASGNHGAIKSFVPITYKSASSSGLQVSGVVLPKASIIYVNSELFASLTEKIVLSVPEEKLDFAGVDSSLTVLYNVFSDLQVGGDVTAFIGKDSSANKFTFTAKASLAF